ncbi:diguanylate cyclase [Massilia sp. METH4]|uniref:sensor domain-containing diguanylate cyclase n=1 Tax=Massilia sp. METH4 TaxID=3123041 RepID=UPI0030D572CA
MTAPNRPTAPPWRQRLARIGLAPLVLVPVLALAAGLAALLAYSMTWQQQVARLELSAVPRLERFAIQLFAPPRRYTYLPHLLANDRLLRSALEQPHTPELVRLANMHLAGMRASTGATDLYILDPQGTGVAASNWRDKISFVGVNYAYRPYYTRALADGGAHFYAMGTTSKRPGYFMSQLVERDDGGVLGVAVVKADLTMPDVRDYGGEVLVTDAGGVAFLSSRKDWQYRPLTALSASDGASVARTRQYDGVLRPPLRMHTERTFQSGATIVDIAGHGRYFMVWRPVPETDWHVNLLLPLEEVESAAAHMAMLAAGAVALVALSLLYLWQSRLRQAERERSRAALEEAHAALARQHDALQALSEELRVQTITDSLTGLFNRRHFMDSLARLLGTAQRHREPLALLLVDADHFKRVNDEHGHPVGDEVLRRLGAMLREETRDGDVAARYGGEEFIVALPRTDTAAALGVAERVLERMRGTRIPVEGAALTVTVSIGMAAARPGEGAAELIGRADAALYEAKRGGRDRAVTAA